jgi:hypothetical protein
MWHRGGLLRHRAVPVRQMCSWQLPPGLARCTGDIPDRQYNRRHLRGPEGYTCNVVHGNCCNKDGI